MFCWESDPVLKNVLVSNNTAQDGGGGIYCYGSGPLLMNVTLCNNVAISNGGGGISCASSNPEMVNAIFWDNVPQEIWFNIWDDTNTIYISNSDIKGGRDSIVTNDHGTVHWLEGNIDSDPLFAGTGDHPFELLKGSPCIDAGTPDTIGMNLPETDLAGNPRIWNNRIDMGAYEWNNVGIQIQDSRFKVQGFPNPTFGKTDIRYRMPDAGFVELKVFDAMGKEIEVINDWHAPGEYTITFDASDLPAGIYVCILRTEDGAATTKIVKW